MEPAKDIKQGPKQKAERFLPADRLGVYEFEEMAGVAAAGLIRSGDVQYWQLNDTIGVFTQSALMGVWQFELHFSPVIAEMLTRARVPSQLQWAATKAPSKVREIIARALMMNATGPQLSAE